MLSHLVYINESVSSTSSQSSSMTESESDQYLVRSSSDAESRATNKVGYQYYEPQELEAVSSRKVVRTGSNISELSRIISGLRDDQQIQIGTLNVREDPEQILVEQLDLVSRLSTRKDPEVPRDDIQEVSLEKDFEDLQSPPPDGGFGWVIAICAMLSVFATWGCNAGFGVFLNYYLSSGTFPGALEYDFALIGGIVVFIAQGMAPLSMVAYKMFGLKVVCLTGIVFQTAGYLLASFATQIWQLYLTQGVLVGISFSLIFIPATLVLPTWFDKRMATSMGICVSGAGLGGVVFSLSINKVIETTGSHRWALRMCCFVTLAVALVSSLVMRPRNHKPIPFSQALTKKFLMENLRLIFDIKVFKNGPMVLLACWFALCLMGYILILFSLAAYGTLVGLSHSQSSTVTSVMNAAQTIGRPLMGMFGDNIGRNNMATGLTLVISILVFAFWINATTFGSTLAFSVVMGLIVGVGSSLAQSIAAVILVKTPEQLPAAWSGLNIFVSVFCLVVEVIALALRQENTKKPFLHTQIFAGVCFFVAFLLGLVIREWVIRRAFTEGLEMSLQSISQLEKAANGYLTTTDLDAAGNNDTADKISVDGDSLEVLQARVDRYRLLLRPRPTTYALRAIYPIVA